MYGYDLNKRVQTIFAVAALYVICLKAHQSNAAATVDRSLAYAKAQAIKKSGGNPATSSYFQRDPYGPDTYAFGFEVNDNRTGNVQFRDERRYVNGSVEGSFGHVRPDGRVIVTHFLSDNERGFLHDTRTFEAGEHEKWQAHWPTKRPDIHMQRPHDMPTGAVVYDKDLHLNLTNSQTPENLANAIKDQHGIDVNMSGNAPENIGHAALQDIIDGKIPLQTVPGKAETHIGFETVNDLLPSDFPIVPFKLPSMLGDEVGASKQQKSANDEQANKKNVQDKYNKAKANNAEKNLSVDMLKKNVTQAVKSKTVDVGTKSNNMNNQTVTDKPLPSNVTPKDAASANDAWYQQLIEDTRNEFLNNLPDLQQEGS
ncbi:uncharacterized protein LOC128861745 [Anastrepha ludens]|uniref:uncharacterized protein LOC128861745 n=1 Tax=Anastrepha ludens TaxID=28586 RepID=UPI0023AFD17F|nr:uncharacterized protein LOC128861745 [Anastrepha ludens]